MHGPWQADLPPQAGGRERGHAALALDADGVVTSCNAGAERVTGYRRADLLGKSVSFLDTGEGLLDSAAADGAVEGQCLLRRGDGSSVRAGVLITAVRDGLALRGFGMVLRTLSGGGAAAIVGAYERDRARLAAEVHDDSIQAMVAAGMRLQLLEGRLDGRDQALVVGLHGAVDAAISRLRDLLRWLRPPELRHGLAGALADWAERSGYLLVVELDEEPAVAVATVVYRTLQDLPRGNGGTVRVRSAEDGLLVDCGGGPVDDAGRVAAIGGRWAEDGSRFWVPGTLG
ncbi:histidine kinase [Amycolatopsis minnesotensis]|uniref:PAS domain-containing protein n=1 Tax=Amycolatopsis minnesotensis TaxID=337894 RepID=A0ABN2RKQ2_9PSEU